MSEWTVIFYRNLSRPADILFVAFNSHIMAVKKSITNSLHPPSFRLANIFYLEGNWEKTDCLSPCYTLHEEWLDLGPDREQAKTVTHYISSHWSLPNICSTGTGASDGDPGTFVVLGHCCQSSISRTHLRLGFRRREARSCFITGWAGSLVRCFLPSLISFWLKSNATEHLLCCSYILHIQKGSQRALDLDSSQLLIYNLSY